MKKYLRKIKRKISNITFKVQNKLFCTLNKKKFTKKIALISCDKYINRVSNDLYLKDCLNKNLIDVEIISWQDKSIDYKKFDACIITTVWGYQDYINEFEEFLNNLEKENILVINSIDIIKNNYEKETQFNLLDKYNIPHIDTLFIEKNTKDIKSLIDETKELVIKPCISGSGDNTYIINSNRKNSLDINQVNDTFKDINSKTKLMVQPFIKEIDNGELSLIYLNNEFKYAIKRYPSKFNNKNTIELIDIEFDDKLNELINKVKSIEEYKNNLYMRIDIIKQENNYLIMELELIEPDLFFYKLDKQKRNLILNDYSKEIKKVIR